MQCSRCTTRVTNKHTRTGPIDSDTNSTNSHIHISPTDSDTSSANLHADASSVNTHRLTERDQHVVRCLVLVGGPGRRSSLPQSDDWP